jgi:hypothetical protein
MIDPGFVAYGLLLAAILGSAVAADARRRARRKRAHEGQLLNKLQH